MMMSGFKAPFRITTVYDRLKKRPELNNCKITIEEMEEHIEKGEDVVYPRISYDTPWVWVRWEGRGRSFAMRIAGRLQDGVFYYLTSDPNLTSKNGSANLIDKVDAAIDFVVEKFKAFPKNDK
jgi:hypothetical protein